MSQQIVGVALLDWRCPKCGYANCDTSDNLHITCEACGKRTTFKDVTVTASQLLENLVDRYRIWSEK